MKPINAFAYLIFFLVIVLGALLAYSAYSIIDGYEESMWAVGIILVFFFFLALFLAATVKIADQWERAIVLRLGKFKKMQGPGLFFIIPIIDTIPYWIDLRVITTPFKAEKTLTKDTVPVDVDAVLFWQVKDPEKCALEVEDYKQAISWASQTALRDVIGKSNLSEMLEGRERIDTELAAIIEDRTAPWGVHVISVEIRDVLIPQGLQHAMSMQAQAERERQARVILGDSERQIAHSFEEASKAYANNPTALHLRAMNMLFEGLKEKGSLIIVPSSALDTMNLGAMTGLAALAKPEKTAPENPDESKDRMQSES
ncbi:MAG: slipin family protein [Planctomycetes bacterium]|nr:slipin family protein [Planctomycetota bacterium]